jgi:transcriptional regulator with XRE-family HTH domain
MSLKGGTLRAQWLGKMLRDLRESAGLSLKEAGDDILRDPSTVSRMETATSPPRLLETRQLLNLYGADDPALHAALEQLTRDIWVKGWWDRYARSVHVRMVDLAWLESFAERVCAFSPLVLNDLLQTKEYAEAVMRAAGPDDTDDQIGKRIEFRMKRQEVLDKLDYDVVIDEAALQRVVDDPRLMRNQLAHLLGLSYRSNITIRVHPFSAGTLASPDGSFTMLTMPAPYPSVAHVPNVVGAVFVEMPEAERFVAAYTRLQRAALDADDSRTWIKARMEQLT